MTDMAEWKEKFEALLGEGWGVSFYEGNRYLNVSLPNNDGGVTIWPKERCWAPGGGNRPSRLNHTKEWFGVSCFGGDEGYTGRGWMERMVRDIKEANKRRLEDLDRIMKSGGFGSR